MEHPQTVVCMSPILPKTDLPQKHTSCATDCVHLERLAPRICGSWWLSNGTLFRLGVSSVEAGAATGWAWEAGEAVLQLVLVSYTIYYAGDEHYLHHISVSSRRCTRAAQLVRSPQISAASLLTRQAHCS
jgi:hypothetical protein